jgi:hypothetical protein
MGQACSGIQHLRGVSRISLFRVIKHLMNLLNNKHAHERLR